MHVQPLEAVPDAHALAASLCDAPGLARLDGDGVHADGRWSFIGVEPVERIERSSDDPEPLAALDGLEPENAEPRFLSVSPLALALAHVPSWIGYVAYDAAWSGRAGRLVRERARPVLSFARYDALLAIDHRERCAYLVGDDRAAVSRLQARLDQPGRVPHASAGPITVAPAERHRAAIAIALERIARGDVYQVNLARCFRAPLSGDPLALWLALRKASPVPFGAYLALGERVIAARTMERFLLWDRATGALSNRPIKGTLRRSGDGDASESALLRADPKERAEHAMIVDLMRNDLGRVARIGSVSVPEVMAVEPFAGLHHLVSTVTCRTRTDVRLRDVLAATFPPGSVTGAPKIAAVELIEALEPEPRDAYTGALGFVDRAGGLSLAVAIRGAQLEAGTPPRSAGAPTWGVRYFSGGGIVEASDPDREVAETELKAEVFRQALTALAAR
jgi:anthranilate/para-aminobenzoate synthase component I